MQGGIFSEPGLFITLKMLDTAFNLRSEALSNVFDQMVSQYGIFLQRDYTTPFSGAPVATAQVTVGHPGWGYHINDILTIIAGNSDCTLKVLSIGGIGQLQSVAILTRGTGYNTGYDFTTTVAPSGGVSGRIDIRTIGTNSTEGLCAISDLNHITVEAFKAIVKDSDGVVKGINVESQQTIDFTGKGDGTWKVLAQVKKKYNEEGTILLTNGSKDVVGTDTKFTEILGAKMQLVILDSVEGSNGEYEVESVTSDVALTLKDAFTGTTESDLPFSVGGVFPDPNIYPATIAGYRCYEKEDYEFILSQSAVAAHQLYLGDVVIAGGVISTVADQRTAFKFKPHAHVQADITDFQISAGQILGTGAGKALDDITIGLNVDGEAEVKDGSIADEKLEYKLYRIKISQSGTSAPSPTVVKNTLGMTPTWNRNSGGEFYADFDGGADVNKIFPRISHARGAGAKFLECDVIYYSGSMRVWIYTINLSGSVADDLLTGDALEILVYP